MKKYLLIIVLGWIFGKANAQGGLNYASLGIGVSAGINRPYADLKNEYANKSFAITGNYFFTPYVPIGLELQFGKLAGGGNSVKEDKDTRRYVNNYKALMLHMDIQLGEIMDYQGNAFLNTVKNFYAGAGVGAIYNKVDANRESLTNIGYVFPGKDKSVNFVIPLRFGYEFKFYNSYDEPNFRLDIGYQHYLTFGEGLDGYDDRSTKFKNNALDQYRLITVGIKYNFGGETSYDKDIRGN